MAPPGLVVAAQGGQREGLVLAAGRGQRIDLHAALERLEALVGLPYEHQGTAEPVQGIYTVRIQLY